MTLNASSPIFTPRAVLSVAETVEFVPRSQVVLKGSFFPLKVITNPPRRPEAFYRPTGQLAYRVYPRLGSPDFIEVDLLLPESEYLTRLGQTFLLSRIKDLPTTSEDSLYVEWLIDQVLIDGNHLEAILNLADRPLAMILLEKVAAKGVYLPRILVQGQPFPQFAEAKYLDYAGDLWVDLMIFLLVFFPKVYFWKKVISARSTAGLLGLTDTLEDDISTEVWSYAQQECPPLYVFLMTRP